MDDDRKEPTRILVVEDDPVGREVLVEALRQTGYDVLVAETGEAALAILREFGGGIDWLFADICLPGVIDGWVVGSEFRLSHPFRPIIYASAYEQDQARRDLGSIFVAKPIRPAEVVAIFKQLSEEAREGSDLVETFTGRRRA